jgi:hypothetical protein
MLIVLGALVPVSGARAQAATQPAPAVPPRPAPAPAPERDAALPSARQVIDRHIAAIGGRAAILARTSSHASGSMSIPSTGMTGSVDVFAAKPDKSLFRMTIGGIGAIEEGFDGTIGWSLSPMTGPALVQGKELEQKRFESDFFSDLHPDERYDAMWTVEKTDFEGRPCYKVRLVRRGSSSEEFEFYDVETGLKAGGISTRESPMGPITSTSVESNYRKFGPLLQPTTIKATAMGLQQVITIANVEYDNVDPAVFEPPATIKALVK